MNSAFYGMYQFIYQEGVVIPERSRLLEPFQDLYFRLDNFNKITKMSYDYISKLFQNQ